MARRLTIGIPVYNGENYLRPAIESILAQTFTDYELIISDNASDDGTQEICEEFAAADPRVRYVRNEKNLGAAANYNQCFYLAEDTEFFKWHAHDDIITPDFLERCIAALDADPGAILCRTLVSLIDGDDNEVGIYDQGLVEATSERASDRFAAIILPPHMGTDFFGVIRSHALEGTPLHGTYHGSDQVLLAVLALRGRFLKIDEPLFKNRSHPERYSDGIPIEKRGWWHDTSGTRKTRFPLWRQYREYAREVSRQLSDPAEKRRCRVHLARWWFTNWNAVRMGVDVVGAVEPRAFDWARRAKQRLVGLNERGFEPGFEWEHWRRDTESS